MATRALGPAALLLLLLAACGGDAEAPPAPAPDPAAGIEEETPAASPATQAAANAAQRKMRVDESMLPQPGETIRREVYAYTGGSRDPFASVLDGNTAGPELADLDLVGVIYIPRAPSTSVATLRDRLNGKRYNVREGDRLGRMRVTDIRQKDVSFTIDDYGTERQEILSLRKQEGNAP